MSPITVGVPDYGRALPQHSDYDIVIIGSGMGGGTVAWALRESGARILLLERGQFLATERENWDVEAVFTDGRYRNADSWYDDAGEPFAPRAFHYVGGNTKLYGGALVRFRREDFQESAHADGVSPSWFMSYDELAPYYTAAEQLFRVHGEHDDDPTLVRSEPFPYPAVGHEPAVERAAVRLRKLGLTPSALPMGIDRADGGGCVRCSTCDGFPCLLLAKADADVACVRPAVASGAVELVTGAYVRSILTDETGRRATELVISCGAREIRVRAGTVVVAAGAVESAALLMRSANSQHPNGLANGSDLVGRNYMAHNNSVMIGVDPLRKNTTVFQKTLYLNDFYLKGSAEHPFPLGHAQLIGKVQGAMLANETRGIPKPLLNGIAAHSLDWWLMSEDLPNPENRVTLRPDGAVAFRYRRNNLAAHEALIVEMRNALRAIGYPVVLTRTVGENVNAHHAGTARAGADPSASVLDETCRAHELENLYVVDSSFFPSLPPAGPALTIAANALRVGEQLLKT